jgi:alcohol dehydrogenase (cytochrome c)
MQRKMTVKASPQLRLRMAAAAVAALGAATWAQPGSAQESNTNAPPPPAAASQSSAGNITTVMKEGLPPNAKVSISDDQLKNAEQDTQNWLLDGRTYDNDRYSPLKQISVDNVKSLMPTALVQTGMAASFEVTPIVADGVMYITTPIVESQMKIMALNAVTGARLWEATYKVGVEKLCCGPVNRGVAIGYGHVFAVTEDDQLIALDAKTGKTVWQTQIIDPRAGYSESMAPQLYDGMIIVGSSGAEFAIRGFVAAYDAQTGKQIWRWDATDPNTFEGDSWKTGGGTVWNTPAIDAKRGLVLFAVANPNPDLNGDSRKGDNLYTDSIVALDVKTGKLAWYYQEVKHDLWDFDAVSNVLLFDAKDNDGKTVPAAGEAGKVGYFFIVNRENGKLIRKAGPFVTIDMKTFGMPPTKDGLVFQPGPGGGSEWSPPAYSPDTHDVYVLGANQPFKLTTSEPSPIPGLKRWGSTLTPVDMANTSGTISAINVDTGKIDWQVKTPQPMVSGVLATAGNLVFTGENNGWFDAFDAKTGKRVWRFQLGAGVNAPPVTYEADGQQYIAVAAGGNFLQHSQTGDTLAIFKLFANGAVTH